MFERKTMDDLGRLSAEESLQSEKQPIIIILDEVRSMHNVGSAFRTADSFGVKSIYLCGFTPIPPHRDIRKTALGAEESVHWQHFETVTDAIADARKHGYRIISIEQVHNSTSLTKLEWKPGFPTAFIFGNEISGVSDVALSLSDFCVEIPQSGAKHSLNVSVSMGVVLWEAVRSAR